MVTVKDIRDYIIPKLCEAVNAAGRYKSPQCAECKKVWLEIQDFFDEKERERFELHICGEHKDWTK
jgi:hypothetical protein